MEQHGLPRLILVGGLGAVAALASAGGCFEPGDKFVNYTTVTVTSGVGAEGGAGVGGGGPEGAREFFEQEVKPIMVPICGESCHGGPPFGFLQFGQEYAAITTYKTALGVPLLVKPAEKSLLMTYPPNPDHTGPTWNGLDDLKALVLEWLQKEEANIVTSDVLQVGPVEPNGLTVLPLDPLAPDLAGVKLVFYAQPQGNPPELLVLSDIEIWPPNGRGVRVTDPTFVVIRTDTSEVLDTSFHGDPLVMVAPDQVQLGPGQLLLTTWGPGFKLAVRFGAVQGLFADETGATFDPCTRVDLFTEGVDALPVQPSSSDPNGLLYCAEQCHGGTSGAVPTTKMSLVELTVEPYDYDLACAKVRPYITPTNPAESQLSLITKPGPSSAGHPFKFGGNNGAHGAFVDAMTEWIDEEGAAP
jgi:hypothetical protein